MYKVGDRIKISKEIANKLREMPPYGHVYGSEEGEEGTCFAQRLDRNSGQMAIKWDSGVKTNVYFLRKAGLNFEEPKFETLSIKECPEEFLSDTELVIKGLMEIKGISEYQANQVVEKLYPAMNKYGIIFYRP